MPFHAILTDLVEADNDVVAAMFVDDSGELIGHACRDGEDERVELIAAYLPLYLQRLRAALETAGIDPPRLVHIQRQRLHLHAAALPEEYIVSLVTGPRAPAPLVRRRLAQAAERLADEVLGAG